MPLLLLCQHTLLTLIRYRLPLIITLIFMLFYYAVDAFAMPPRDFITRSTHADMLFTRALSAFAFFQMASYALRRLPTFAYAAMRCLMLMPLRRYASCRCHYFTLQHYVAVQGHADIFVSLMPLFFSILAQIFDVYAMPLFIFSRHFRLRYIIDYVTPLHIAAYAA